MKEVLTKYFTEILIGIVFIYFSFAYLPFAYANITIVVLSVLFILVFSYQRKKLIPVKVFRNNYLLLIIPFVLTLLAVVFSEDMLQSLGYFWNKFPILIVPFIILSVLGDKKQLKTGVGIFIVFSLIGFVVTLYRLLQINPVFYQLSSEFSQYATIIQHPYFGIYQLVALVFLIEFYRKSLNKYLFWFLVFIFSLGVLISTSRISYILYMIILFLYILTLFSKRKAITLLVIMLGTSILLIGTNKPIQKKFTRSLVYKTSPRLILWKNAYLVLKNSKTPILGVSIDYYKDGTKDPYWLKGKLENSKNNSKGLKGYNSHNQYIEFILINGILGILYLLLILYTFYKAVKTKDIFILSLILIVGVFSFTESILSRQYGVILYAVLMPIIFRLVQLKNSKKVGL